MRRQGIEYRVTLATDEYDTPGFEATINWPDNKQSGRHFGSFDLLEAEVLQKAHHWAWDMIDNHLALEAQKERKVGWGRRSL